MRLQAALLLQLSDLPLLLQLIQPLQLLLAHVGPLRLLLRETLLLRRKLGRGVLGLFLGVRLAQLRVDGLARVDQLTRDLPSALLILVHL